MKPNKWGYKIFVFSNVSDFGYDFEFYTGKQDNVILNDEKDCGASGNVVIRLARSIPSNVNHKVFYDNYFNSPDLQIVLARRGILSDRVTEQQSDRHDLRCRSEEDGKGDTH